MPSIRKLHSPASVCDVGRRPGGEHRKAGLEVLARRQAVREPSGTRRRPPKPRETNPLTPLILPLATEQVERRADDRLGVDAVARRGRRRPRTGRTRRRRGSATGRRARAEERQRVRVAVEHGDQRRGRSAGNSSSRIPRRARRRGRARRCSARNTRSGLVRQTTPAATPRALQRPRRRASTSGIIAPTPTSVDLRRPAASRGAQPVAAGDAWRRRSRARPGPSGTAASAGSIGRVESRKYAERAARAARAATARAGSTTPGPGRTPAPTPRSRAARCRSTGVVIDWCAPPSGASVTPDGVPTRIDWPPA